MNYKLSFINIVLFLCSFVCLFIIFQCLFAFINVNFIFCILGIMPFFILLFIKFISIKYKWNKKLINIITVIFIINAIFYWLIIECIMHIQYFPSKINYKNSLNALKKKDGIERLAHFPEKIPPNARNYFMQVENSFDGYNMNYLSYDIDKSYIDEMFNNYKKDCAVIGSYRELYNKGIKIYINFLDDNDEICILKKETQKENYTSGLIFGYAINKIYFFYSNY